MPCYKPITINKRGYVDLRVQVPCGQCIGCRIDRAGDWATRCVHEASLHDLNCFVTLTYDDDHLPATGSLVKRDLQNFMRYLRRQHKGVVRYYACGEYGDQTLRPHYHALLFGLDFPDKRPVSKNDNGDQVFTSPLLDKIWGKGQCWLGSVSLQSAGYVAKYCIKKVNGDMASSHYQGRTPEFALMSLKPGIGAGWYDKHKADIYPSDFLIIRGKKRPPPRFYDDRYKQEDELELSLLKKRRIAKARQHRHDQTPERLAVREECTTARFKTTVRTI